jgi:hypothetical protein
MAKLGWLLQARLVSRPACADSCMGRSSGVGQRCGCLTLVDAHDTVLPKLGLVRRAVTAIPLAIVGFFFGILFVPQLFRWIVLVRTAVAPQEGDFLGPLRRRLLWATPLVLLMHPAPYLLLDICWIAVRAAMGRVPYPWPSILAGFCAGVALIVASTVIRLVSLRRLRCAGRRASFRIEKYEHRDVAGSFGHNRPQEAPHVFAQAVVDADRA